MMNKKLKCFHTTVLFSPHAYKMSSNSFDKYLIFCRNLKENVHLI